MVDLQLIPKWPLDWPVVIESIRAAAESGDWGKYHGQAVQDLKSQLAVMLGIQHVWPCCSGTIAIELALRGLGIGGKRSVILAGYDFPGNFRAIEAVGGRPVLVDVVPDGYVMDPSIVESAITSDTAAVIVSHLHGQIADVQTIKSICQRMEIPVIEDACQVPGAIVNGRPAGTTGDVGVFSFGGSKLLTAGRGGAIVTNDEQILQRIIIATERGNDAYPISTLQAAAVTPQLSMLGDLNRQRLAAAHRLRDAIQKGRGQAVFRTLSDPWTGNDSPAFYKFPVRIDSPEPRQEIMEWLVEKGVPAAEGFRGFTKRSRRRCDRIGNLENAKRASEKTILIHHPVLLGPDKLIDQIAATFAEAAEHLPLNQD